MCYVEPNCVSINLGLLERGKHKCELNNATTLHLTFKMSQLSPTLLSRLYISYMIGILRKYNNSFTNENSGILRVGAVCL